MEKIVEELEKELRNVIEGRQLKKKREKLGDLIDLRFYRMVVFALQWTSVGYQSALRLAGMKLGRRLGESSNKTELSLVLEEIKNLFEFLKEGEVEIEILPEVKSAWVRIYESSLTAGVPNILENLCFFEEGFIEGYLDGAISKTGALSVAKESGSITKVSVEEKRCVGLGDKFCGFLIKF